MQTYTLQQLANVLEADIHGDPNHKIQGIATLTEAEPGQITFFNDPRRLRELQQTKASAIITTAEAIQHISANAIVTQNPYLGYARLANLFDQSPASKVGIHPTAVVADSAKLGDNISIGPNVVIADNAQIGANTIIAAGCYIGANVSIGAECHIHPNVNIYYNVQIADHVLIHSGAVIGADGFGFAHDGSQWVKIPQIGSVRIGHGVEVGPNCCIDRGALSDTVLEDGVKLDDMVQIAHNVRVGAHTAMAGCSGIAGSTTVGKNCQIGGRASLNGHITIADNVIIAGTAMVTKSIDEPGIYSSGTGLQTNREWRKSVIRFRQLDNMAKRIQKLEKRLAELTMEEKV